MPSPSPAIALYSGRTITGLGPVAEIGTPILIESIECSVTEEKEVIRGACNSIIAIGWGNVSAEWRITCEELARYGVQDSHPGKLSPTVLTNLAKPEFGCLPENGLFLFSGGSRTRRPGRLPAVSFTVTCDNITKSAGSWEGASTPGIQIGAGGSAGTRPAFTFTSPSAATLGTAFSKTLTATGSGTLTWSVAEGYTLPSGLSLAASTGVVFGTPTGVAREETVVFKVSNAYGYDTQSLVFLINEASVATVTQQVYVRFQIVSATPATPDELWVIGYSGMSPAPTSKATFYSGTPGALQKEAGAPNITDPSADTGTFSGRNWTIREIVGLNGDGDYEVWYRLDGTVDNYIPVLIASGQDPTTTGNGTESPDWTEPPDPEPPDDDDPPVYTAPPTWPGYRAPSPNITHYYLYERVTTGQKFVGAVGGSYSYADLTDFETQHPSIETAYTDATVYSLIELYEVGTGYLYQRDVGDTAISTAYGLSRSPYYYADTTATRARFACDATRRTAAAFTPTSLPADPGGLTGPAPDTNAKVYARTRNPVTGEQKTYGFSTSKAGNRDTLNEWTNAQGTWNIASQNREIYYYDYGWFDDSWVNSYSREESALEILMELWVWDGANWDGLWLYPGETELVGECLAAGVSPVNNAHTAPGTYYA